MANLLGKEHTSSTCRSLDANAHEDSNSIPHMTLVNSLTDSACNFRRLSCARQFGDWMRLKMPRFDLFGLMIYYRVCFFSGVAYAAKSSSFIADNASFGEFQWLFKTSCAGAKVCDPSARGTVCGFGPVLCRADVT
jgi:hypothetical protein